MKKASKETLKQALTDFEYKGYTKEGKYMGLYGITPEEATMLASYLKDKFLIYENEK